MRQWHSNRLTQILRKLVRRISFIMFMCRNGKQVAKGGFRIYHYSMYRESWNVNHVTTVKLSTICCRIDKMTTQMHNTATLYKHYCIRKMCFKHLQAVSYLSLVDFKCDLFSLVYYSSWHERFGYLVPYFTVHAVHIFYYMFGMPKKLLKMRRLITFVLVIKFIYKNIFLQKQHCFFSIAKIELLQSPSESFYL